jgi:L-alanine-DL-glutamate epimerase-like enolase superfamily enzyme
MKITRIEHIPLKIPYQERVLPHLQKGWNFGNRATDEEFQENKDEFQQQWDNSSPPSEKFNLYRVHTDEGLIGTGEGSLLDDEKLHSYVDRDPFEFIMDDSVGPLQIAFYDLMGQFLGLPIARLLGPSRESAPMAYWSHCYPPEALQQEAKIALENGFRVHKFKRRAHTDVVEQIAAIAEVAPEDYRSPSTPTRPSAPSNAPSPSAGN